VPVAALSMLSGCHHSDITARREAPSPPPRASSMAGPSSRPSAPLPVVPAATGRLLFLSRPSSGVEVVSETVQFDWRGARAPARLELSRRRDPWKAEHHRAGNPPLTIEGLSPGAWFWRVTDGDRTSSIWSLRVVGSAKRVARQGLVAGSDFDGDGVSDFPFRGSLLMGGTDLVRRTKDMVRVTSLPIVPCTPDPIAPSRGCVGFGRPASLGDVDGDGFADFAADVPGGGPIWWRGRATPTSPLEPAGRLWKGRTGEAHMGAVVRLGDVNGDGFADVAFRSAGTEPCQADYAVHLGSEEGLDETPSSTLTGFRDLAGGADIDGDGFHDMAALHADGSVQLFRGSPQGTRAAPDGTVATFRGHAACDTTRFVTPQITLVDWNTDGFADVVTAWSSASPVAPVVSLLYGGGATPLLIKGDTLKWPLPGCCESGFSLCPVQAGAGDKPSLIVADRAWATELHAVRPAERKGLALQAAPRVADPTVSQRFTLPVGDVNGDGRDDVMVELVADADGSSLFELVTDDPRGRRFKWTNGEVPARLLPDG
jgi:hypothetical protein